jgi:hypothetical protein
MWPCVDLAYHTKKQNELQMFIIRTSYPLERDANKQANEKDKISIED